MNGLERSTKNLPVSLVFDPSCVMSSVTLRLLSRGFDGFQALLGSGLAKVTPRINETHKSVVTSFIICI